MENNEIITGNNIIENTEKIVKTNSNTALKAAAGIGLAILAGVLVYKYVAKPLISKIKSIREQKAKIDSNNSEDKQEEKD
jgi:hypothetical protein